MIMIFFTIHSVVIKIVADYDEITKITKPTVPTFIFWLVYSK